MLVISASWQSHSFVTYAARKLDPQLQVSAMSVVIETTLGDVTVDLFVQERPQTSMNFLKLCKIKYYNLCLFHSVNSNFLAQTGDPTGKGDGGESIFGLIKGKHHKLYQGEKLPKIKHDRVGLLSMVSHGDGMLGSQFFITLSSDLTSLDNEHCVFGQIVEGEEFLFKLNEAVTDDNHRPYQDIRITHTVILEDPFPDPENLEVPPSSPLPPNPKDVAYSRIPADEPLSKHYKAEELDEIVQQREAAARAAILEMVGDIPNVDAAPPENVLFVCKLNPVTTDHDLSIIFSRFGTVKSCEVIKDNITGDSLQYAFVEFEDRKSCEEAYFKMDNVLIDDRRIHVDFSQSVARLKWKGKGKGVEVLGSPPSGGWGNSKRKRRQENVKPISKDPWKSDRENVIKKRSEVSRQYNDDSVRNGKKSKENEVRSISRRNITEKRYSRKQNKLKRRRSSSSSSSSGSSTDSSSSSESSESSYHKRKKSGRKVFVVVKTPRRSKAYKKSRKTKNKKYKVESESESQSDSQKKSKKKKVRRKSSSSEDSSSSEEVDRRKKRKRRSSSSDDEHRGKKRKRKTKNSETSESSSEEDRKKIKNRKRRARDSSSDSDWNRNKKWKKEKSKFKKKRQVKKSKRSHRYETESSSSSD